MSEPISAEFQTRAAVQLGYFEQYLVAAGWLCHLMEHDANLPVPVLLAGAPHDGQGRARSINFAYIPTGSDLETLNLLQLYAPLPFHCGTEYRAAFLAVLMSINLKLPMGCFGMTDAGEIFLRHVWLGNNARLVEQDEFMEAIGLFLAMQELFGDILESVALGRASLDAARSALEAIDDSSTATPPAAPRSILEALIEFFETNQWQFEVVKDTALSTVYQGENGAFLCFAQAREEHQQVVVYSVSPASVPEECRAAMAEFITRANYGLYVGNFELDYSDGEVRFKTSLSLGDAMLTSALIREVIMPNMLIMDQYLPGIQAVIAGKQTPQAAVTQCEDANE